MKVKKLNSNKLINVNINKYRIDWEKSGFSKLEVKFRDLIKPYWFRSMVLFQWRIPGSLLRLDYFNVNIRTAVEISPTSHHGKFNPFFHNNSRLNYLSSIKRDFQKVEYCGSNNIQLLELNEYDLNNFSLQYIKEKFNIDL